MVMLNGVPVVDDSDKGAIFNNYLYSVFTQEDLSNFDSLNQSFAYQSPVVLTVEFSPSIVCSYLASLDVSKACGSDLITTFLLRCCAEEISSPLPSLFNKSMTIRTLPRDWVCANQTYCQQLLTYYPHITEEI